MQSLCLGGSGAAARKQQSEFLAALHERMEQDASLDARVEREWLLRSYLKAKQAAADLSKASEDYRHLWADQRRQHVLRNEMMEAEARASLERSRREVADAKRQKALLAELQAQTEAVRRRKEATMARSWSKPILPPVPGDVRWMGASTPSPFLTQSASQAELTTSSAAGYATAAVTALRRSRSETKMTRSLGRTGSKPRRPHGVPPMEGSPPVPVGMPEPAPPMVAWGSPNASFD